MRVFGASRFSRTDGGAPLQIGLFIYRLGVLVFLVALRDGGVWNV